MGMLVAPTNNMGSICTWIYLPHLVCVASIRSTEDPSGRAFLTMCACTWVLVQVRPRSRAERR